MKIAKDKLIVWNAYEEVKRNVIDKKERWGNPDNQKFVELIYDGVIERIEVMQDNLLED